MGLKDKKYISLREVEGIVGTHHRFVAGEMARRKEALMYITDVAEMAEFIGGQVEEVGLGEDWAIKKEIFPGIEIVFIYNRADDEFPSDFSVLYSGDRITEVRGEDLASLTIACANHILRYVRQGKTSEALPQICYRV